MVNETNDGYQKLLTTQGFVLPLCKAGEHIKILSAKTARFLESAVVLLKNYNPIKYSYRQPSG